MVCAILSTNLSQSYSRATLCRAARRSGVFSPALRAEAMALDHSAVVLAIAMTSLNSCTERTGAETTGLPLARYSCIFPG